MGAAVIIAHCVLVTQARMTIFRPFIILECVHFVDVVIYIEGYCNEQVF
jgi:hypothetical protein